MDTQEMGTVDLTRSAGEEFVALVGRVGNHQGCFTGYRWLHTCGPQRKHWAAGSLQSSRMHMCRPCKSWNLSPQNHWSGYTITKMRVYSQIKKKKKKPSKGFAIHPEVLKIWNMMSNGWLKRPLDVPSTVPQHGTPGSSFKTLKCSNIAFVVTFYRYICQM